MIGVIGDRAAVLAVDGGDPKTVKVGQKWSGITVISVERSEATVEIDGKRRVLKMGQHYHAAAATADRQSVTLAADPACGSEKSRSPAGVDGVVLEHGLNIVLLGMSFHNRVEMKHDGHTMVLTRRF
ncbi:MAG TPA: hypothetical protein VFO02_13180 [Burkholderiales bacterium]|nr:hypothetical protein [Burkholderiales bacterium]